MSIKAALLGICVSITVFATAQNYGSGLGKTTYTASDAIGVSQWLLSLLPTQPVSSSLTKRVNAQALAFVPPQSIHIV